MIENHLEIDISKSKRKENLIKINLGNDEVVQFNFSNLYIQSKYLQGKYKYSEGIYLIQQEIHDIEEKMNISSASIKLFLEVIEEEKVKFLIEHYKDIYTLSEYFCTTTITAELDKIKCENLFQDLNFTIQILLDSVQLNNGYESKLLIKIENFLKTRIDECFSNAKFKELPNSTIFRILDEIKDKIDQNLLIDFILESASTRFVMFKLVEIDKLSEDKVIKFIDFVDNQEESVKKMYLEYIPFNASFIKNLMKELNDTKNNCKQKDMQLKEMNEELNETKMKCDQKDIQLKELNEELNKIKIEEKRRREELEECKREMKQAKKSIKVKKDVNKQYTQSIIVAGLDEKNILGEYPNNKNDILISIISPPLKLSFDPSSLLSYSTYNDHSVLVMSDGSLKAIGINRNGQISSTLYKTDIHHFTDFCIKDSSGSQLPAISAVCYSYGTLYMCSKSGGNERQLVLCDENINGGDPIFLDIGNHQPVSLFGGYYHSATICDEGEVIFINHDSIKNSPIAAVSLPDGEKASSVACCRDTVVVLSSNGRVFTSPIKSNGVLNFSIDFQLSDQEIVCVSGTCDHCLAVNKEGRVFGRGSNEGGELGLGERTGSVSSFTEIWSLLGYEIKAAYAGCNHSLFQTREGKILSCGSNCYGELLLRNEPYKSVYVPKETTITSGAAFCIPGNHISAVLIGNGPPPNTPNTRIDE